MNGTLLAGLAYFGVIGDLAYGLRPCSALTRLTIADLDRQDVRHVFAERRSVA